MKIAFLSALFMLMPAAQPSSSEALGYWRGPAWGCRWHCTPPVVQAIPVSYQWVLVANRRGTRFRWRLIGVPSAQPSLQPAPMAAPPAPSS